jgi:YD repeat-containing protein
LPFDGPGSIRKQVTPGQTVEYSLDPAGRVLQIRSPNGDVLLQHEYTPMDSLEATIALSTSFTLDSAKRIAANPSTEVSTKKYDSAGNLIRATRPGEPVVEYKYDEMGRRQEELRGGRRRFLAAYDSLGRVKRIECASGWTHTITYTESQRAVTVSSVNGANTETRTYTLDEAGAVSGFTSSVSPVSLTFENTALGKPRTVTYHAAGADIGQVFYSYSRGNRLSRETRTSGASLEMRYDFDPNLRLTGMHGGGAAGFTFTYNSGGLLRMITRDTAATDQSTFSYAPSGMLRSVTHVLGGTPAVHYSDHAENPTFEQRPSNESSLWGTLCRLLASAGGAEFFPTADPANLNQRPNLGTLAASLEIANPASPANRLHITPTLPSRGWGSGGSIPGVRTCRFSD